MFELVNKGEISRIVFQNYILDDRIKLLQSFENKGFHITLYERLVEDCVKCFSKISLDREDYEYLLKRYNKFKKQYNFIEYSECDIKTIENKDITDTVRKIIDIINDDLVNGIQNRVIKIRLDEKLNVDRIKLRNRNYETSDVNYEIIDYYDKI
jgi:2-phosphoglycerate kinase